jgi:hypothetical protein
MAESAKDYLFHQIRLNIKHPKFLALTKLGILLALSESAYVFYSRITNTGFDVSFNVLISSVVSDEIVFFGSFFAAFNILNPSW